MEKNWQGNNATNWVGTYLGNRIDLTYPDPRQISIIDIAQALGNQCRFTGQVAEFYSVAEHCMHCSDLVPDEYKLAALLHDAQEAFIADLSTPMKAEVGRAYRDVEDRIVHALDHRFDMRGQLIELPQCVKDADRSMLMTERDALFGKYEDWGPDFEGAPRHTGFRHLYPNPKHARTAYLERFNELMRIRMDKRFGKLEEVSNAG